MRIKKLELVGFKSFRDRTVIQFDAGITGIVGPNGCGKSNIVDALRWVMGEMSSKNLRGTSMEEVIFAGSDTSAPAGMTEVSMVLENDGGPFPAKYLKHSEVMITRRLHRSGESEYLINKEQARLRDIQEIFMDTGAGAKGFSVIEQGAIGKIITAKPEDRRTLIEEAAGITKFKTRKRESQRKLTSTDQNLVRLADIITELKRQLDSLQRQAQRAERYKKLKEQAQDLDLWLSSSEYLELKEVLNAAQVAFEEAQATEIQGESDIGQFQALLEEIRTSLGEKENKVNDHQHGHADLQRSTQDLDRLVTELRVKIEQGVKSDEMTGSILLENEKRRDVLASEKNELVEKLEAVEREANQLTENYETEKSSLDEHESRIQEIDETLIERRRTMMATSQAQSAVEAQVNSMSDQTEDLLSRVASSKTSLEELNIKKKEFEGVHRQVNDRLESEKQMQFDIMKDVENFEENKKAIFDQVDSKRTDVQEYKDRLNEVTSRLYGLENLQSNFEGFEEGVKSIMLWQKQSAETHADGRVSQVSHFKPVADVVEVQDGYEVAMEAALGTRLQMLLGENSGQAMQAVDFLKSQNSGRSSFLATDVSVGSDANINTPSGEGVVGYLNEVVKVPEKYESQVSLILKDVAIVDSIRTALRLRATHTGWSFVTRDGDMLDENGVLTGGAEESADSGVLKRKKEIKELSQKKDEWAGKLSLAQAALKKLEAQLQQIEEDLERAREENTRKEIALAELHKDLERSETELNSVNLAVEKQENEVSQAQMQLTTHEERLAELREKATELKSKSQNLETETEELDSELQSRRMGLSDLQSRVTELHVSSSSKSQELQGLQRQREMIEGSLSDVEQILARMNEESTKNNAELSEHQILLEEKRVELDRQIIQVEESEKQMSALRDEYENALSEVREVEEKVNAGLRERSERQAKMNEAQLKLDQSRMKEQYLCEQIEERYMVDLSAVATNFVDREGDLNEAKSELEELRKKLNRIGEVNLSAIEEFGDLEDRYNFLSQQQADLNEAKEQLRKVIDRINRICSRRFKETFEAVNDRFQKVFPVLFGGGEARLILIEDEEKGEMGVDIVAKPPGKKMTSVSLMSGGEKALTAVSLIFSIFLVKPSPYCLLDEVDAPLDDANVSRFNDLVKEMAKRSQIIVVTHNKHTMAVNKKLYGVTMEERGVSKMVSVSLDEAEKVAEA